VGIDLAEAVELRRRPRAIGVSSAALDRDGNDECDSSGTVGVDRELPCYSKTLSPERAEF
jgi:hypothetical protein